MYGNKEDFTLVCLDCVWRTGKNLQKFNSIDFIFFISTNDTLCIKYSFHESDFNFWKSIIFCHTQDIENYTIRDFSQNLISLEDIYPSYHNIFYLESEELNLFRNMNLIFYLENSTTKANNRNEQIELNTWPHSYN